MNALSLLPLYIANTTYSLHLCCCLLYLDGLQELCSQHPLSFNYLPALGKVRTSSLTERGQLCFFGALQQPQSWFEDHSQNGLRIS